MNKLLYIFLVSIATLFFSCKKESTFKKEFSTYIQPQEIKSWIGKYNILIEDESLSDGSVSGRIWSFTINEKNILLETESYQEPIFCDGEYVYKFEKNILNLYYNGVSENCKSSSPNFSIKKEKDKYLISSPDFGKKHEGKWLILKKLK
jgi:hypothetical protein